MTTIWICYADEHSHDAYRKLIGLNGTEAGARARCEAVVKDHCTWWERQLHEWRTKEQLGTEMMTAAEIAALFRRVETEISQYRAAVWSGEAGRILDPGADDHAFWWITSEELGA